MPNAFAMGRSRKSTTVCATRGILDMLSPAELEGVMAHELTHVINRDVMVMTLASFFATLAVDDPAVRVLLRRRLRQPRRGARHHDRDPRVDRSCTRSRSCCCARSRATASSPPTAARAVLTGRPSALASALLKISGTMERVPSQDLRAAEGMSAFFIIPARPRSR